MAPDLSTLRGPIDEADARFAELPTPAQGVIVAAIARRYEVVAPAATFRIIVRTGVSWIWLGSAIVGLGAVVCAWPTSRRRRAICSSPESITLVGFGIDSAVELGQRHHRLAIHRRPHVLRGHQERAPEARRIKFFVLAPYVGFKPIQARGRTRAGSTSRSAGRCSRVSEPTA